MESTSEEQSKLKRLDVQFGFLQQAVFQKASISLFIASLSTALLVVATFGSDIISFKTGDIKIIITILLALIPLSLIVFILEISEGIKSANKNIEKIIGINIEQEMKNIENDDSALQKIINKACSAFPYFGIFLISLVTCYIIFKIIDSEKKVEVIPPIQSLKSSYEKKLSEIKEIELACFTNSRFECYKEKCEASAPSTYYFVDYGTDSGTYFRCNPKDGCDSYHMAVRQSGEYTQFIPSERQAMMFKVLTGDILPNKGEFVDIATLGTQIIISSGKCEFVR